MKNITLSGTFSTPTISLNYDSGILEFKGVSFPEDVLSFYNPVIKWLDDYVKSPNNHTEAIFKFTYTNSASTKIVLFILKELQKIHTANNDVVVKWYYEEEDEDMQETGEAYLKLLKLPFKVIQSN